MPRSVLFTHNDLDALTCALLTRLAMPDCDVYFCTYDNLPELMARRCQAYDVVWIADLSLKNAGPELATLRTASPDEVRWFDHHASSDDQDWMTTCLVDRSGDRCAADVLADWLSAEGHEIPAPLQTLLEYAHDQDLWIRAKPEAAAFDDILGNLAIQKVFDALSADPLAVYQPTREMQQAGERTRQERAWSVSLAQATAHETPLDDSHRVRAVCCWGSTSQVGDELGDPQTLVALVDLRGLERGQLRFSLRTQALDIDAARVAEVLGGGGHPQAAGATIGLEALQALTEAIGRLVAEAAQTAHAVGPVAPPTED